MLSATQFHLFFRLRPTCNHIVNAILILVGSVSFRNLAVMILHFQYFDAANLWTYWRTISTWEFCSSVCLSVSVFCQNCCTFHWIFSTTDRLPISLVLRVGVIREFQCHNGGSVKRFFYVRKICDSQPIRYWEVTYCRSNKVTFDDLSDR